MKVKLEYIWLDGEQPEPNLRSKVKVIDLEGENIGLKDATQWSFDGSSTKQAEGSFSDCLLQPVKMYRSPFQSAFPTYFVLCEVLNSDGSSHPSNKRSLLDGDDTNDGSTWFGFEQEYTLMKKGRPMGFPKGGYPEGQGKYYCGVGDARVHGRDFVNAHLDACLTMGLEITGTNAEVMPGQWEFQVLGKGRRAASDDLWMARYLLELMSEGYGVDIELHPKPVKGDWNGSGLHCNFSNAEMRDGSLGKEYFDAIFKTFEERHEEHLAVYGSSNNERLTGLHETQDIEKFSSGVADRGASIRIPLATAEEWKGYLEDRRPASNANPYEVVQVVEEALTIAKNAILVETNN